MASSIAWIPQLAEPCGDAHEAAKNPLDRLGGVGARMSRPRMEPEGLLSSVDQRR